jgi:hypothetical protein
LDLILVREADEKHGWSPLHDDGHAKTCGAVADAAHQSCTDLIHLRVHSAAIALQHVESGDTGGDRRRQTVVRSPMADFTGRDELEQILTSRHHTHRQAIRYGFPENAQVRIHCIGALCTG